MTKRPFGITIFSIWYGLKGLVALAVALVGAAIIGLVPGALIFGMAIGTLFAIFAVIQFAIAGALFSGRSWARMLVIALAIIDLLIGLAMVATGIGATLILTLLIDVAIIYYMFRHNVKQYFSR